MVRCPRRFSHCATAREPRRLFAYHYPIPTVTYGLSKVASEMIAGQIAQWSGAAFVALRFSNIIVPSEYQEFPSFWSDPHARKWNLWGYVDVRDAARACRLALEAPADAVAGSPSLIIAAADSVMNRPSSALLTEVFPDVPLTREIGEFGTLLATDRARQLIGCAPLEGDRTEERAEVPHMLEAGCGPGRLSIVLAREYGLEVTGLDLDPAMIERARGRAVPSTGPRRTVRLVDAPRRRPVTRMYGGAVAEFQVLSEGYLSKGGNQRVGSTVSFVRDDDALVVLDPGLVPARSAILGPLTDLGVEPNDVTDVVISHHHPDHTLNVALFPNARVHDHWAWYRDDLWVDRAAEGFQVSSSVTLIETPGHSPQDISTLVETDEGLVVATHLWWTSSEPVEDPFATDAEALRRNRARVRALPRLIRIVPGHGASFAPDEDTPE